MDADIIIKNNVPFVAEMAYVGAAIGNFFIAVFICNVVGKPLRKRLRFLLEFAAKWMQGRFIIGIVHGLD